MASEHALIADLTNRKLEVAPRMRQAFMIGLAKHCENVGKSLDEVVADWWEEDWKKAGDLLIKFLPREVNIHGTHEHVHQFETRAVSRVVEWIEETAGQGEDPDTSNTGKTRPVLLDQIPDEPARPAQPVVVGKVPGSTGKS
jgi:hypothetical protein